MKIQKKNLLFVLIFLIVLPFLSSAVTLNSPADNNISIYYNLSFSATETTTGSIPLRNATFYDNSTGSWGARNTSSFTGEWVSGEDLTTTTEALTGYKLKKTITVNTFVLRVNSSLYQVNPAGITMGIWEFNYVNTSTENVSISTDLHEAWINVSAINPHIDWNVSSVKFYLTTNTNGMESQEKDSQVISTNVSITSSFINTYIISRTLWNVQFCNNNSVCSSAGANRTFSLDYPNFTIHSPTITSASASTLINVTIGSTGTKSICKYWIMRGASTEKANTTINCSQFNETYSVSGQADYVLYLWANQSGNIVNSTTFNFSYSIPQGPGGGGGGGTTKIIEILQNITTSKICLGTDTKFSEAYELWRVNWFDWTNFKLMWYSLWNHSNCVSSASLIPI